VIFLYSPAKSYRTFLWLVKAMGR